MPRMSRPPSPGQWSSISKALLVLRAFVDHQDQWGVKELSTAIGQPLSSTHRLLQILRAEGLVDWNFESQKYFVGVELQRWADSLTSLSKRHDLGRKAAEAVAALLEQTCRFAIYDPARHRMVYVSEAHGGGDGVRAIHPGTAVGLADGAPGWAVLACLPPEARQEALAAAPRGAKQAVAAAATRGFAVEAGNGAGRGSLAVAVLDGRKLPVGALCLEMQGAGPAEDAAAVLAQAAAGLSERMAGRVLPGVPGAAPHRLSVLLDRAQQQMPEISLEGSGLLNVERLSAIEEGNAGYCAVTLDRTEAAFLGKPPFTRPHTRLRLMMILMPLHLHIVVRRASPLRSVADLLEARVSAGGRSYVTSEVWRNLLGLLAPSAAARRKAEGKLIELDYADANQAFLDGTIDALISLNEAPVPAYQALARRVPIRLLGLEPTVAAAYAAKSPVYAPGYIPAGSYAGMRSAVLTLTTPLGMVTSSERSEAEVHRMVQAIEGSRPGPGPHAPTLAELPVRLAVPIHPGALRGWPSG